MANISSLKQNSFNALRNAMDSYYPLTETTWQAIQTICVLRQLEKGQFLIQAGEKPHTFGYVYKGLLRAYITDIKGKEYNKMFFAENTFPGSMAALLTDSYSNFSVEALEKTTIVLIDFKAYRNLLDIHHDLKWFQIIYLEKNWLLAKEPREISLVQEDATQRYLAFLETYPALESRLSQYHIASHLGITPTQLSRIRKSLADF